MKTQRQIQGDEILNFARHTIKEPTPAQIASFAKRLNQIMLQDAKYRADTVTLAHNGLYLNLNLLPGESLGGWKDLTVHADALEKQHRAMLDAEFLRSTALSMRAYHASNDYDRTTYIARACVKALYACGRADEIKTALMLVF